MSVIILGTLPSVLQTFCSRSISSWISFSSLMRSFLPVSFKIFQRVAFSCASTCFFRYCFRFLSFSSLLIISVASSSFLSFLGLRSGSCTKSLVSPFCRLVLLLLKPLIGDWLEREDKSSMSSSSSSSSTSEDSSESQFSSSSSSRARSTSFCWSGSTSPSSSFSIQLSISFSTSISFTTLFSSSSEISSSDYFLLQLLGCRPLYSFAECSDELFFSRCQMRSSGMLRAQLLGIYPWSWAQCCFQKQKPMLMVTLVDINLYNNALDKYQIIIIYKKSNRMQCNTNIYIFITGVLNFFILSFSVSIFFVFDAVPSVFLHFQLSFASFSCVIWCITHSYLLKASRIFGPMLLCPGNLPEIQSQAIRKGW